MARVLLEKDGRIGRITLNRPEVMNAIQAFLECFDDNMLPHTGDSAVARKLFQYLDDFYPMFNILEP